MGNDLFLTKNILIGDALSGFSWEHKHISGKKMFIKEEVITEHSKKVTFPGWGMPVKGTNRYGSLFVIYNYIYPIRICNKEEIRRCLMTTNFQKTNDSIPT